MASWAALNVVSAPRATLEEARDGATEEAQEARNAALYGRALRLQQQEQVDEASAIYTDLLETATGLSTRLRYLCAKNLATLEAERSAFDAALQRYAEALTLDDTDVLVWYQMGKAALATGEVWLARRAFEAGFQLDATFWPLTHALCDVLQAIGDGDAYQRIANCLVEKDPGAGRSGGPLVEMDKGVDPEFRVCPTAQSRVPSQHPPTLKRRSPALEAFSSAAKKRKALIDSTAQQAQAAASRAPLQYLLQQRSWLSLGKLLLEAYDDVTSERDPGVMVSTRPVYVTANFLDEPPEPEPSTNPGNTAVSSAVPEKQDDEKTLVVDVMAEQKAENGTAADPIEIEDGTAAEPIEIDDGDDGDHEDGGSAAQMNRRKSRRHQDKLREEHELAAKLAREKNLAYRLQAYVPDILLSNNTHVYREVVFRLAGGSVVLEYTNGELIHKFKDVLPSAPSVETKDSANESKGEETLSTSGDLKAINRECASRFVESTMTSTEGVDIVQLLQAYLNQCGTWADQMLVQPSEDKDQTLHLVCLWAEKVVRGRLGDVPLTPRPASEKLPKSRVGMSRHCVDGLTIETRLFLLELHLDDLIYHHANQGQTRPRKAMRVYYAKLDEILRDAQALLLDICWNENTDTDGENDDTWPSRLLIRLFWLSGIASEQRGNIATAREHLFKCKHTLEEQDQAIFVSLPNLRSQPLISVTTVDQKIADLQFSNVCTEVQEMTTTSRFDEAQGRLLSHFFPADGQISRVNELLDDFSTAKQREQERTEGDDADSNDNSLLELLLESIGNSTSSTCSEKVLILLVILTKLEDILKNNIERVRSQPKKADAERHTLRIAVQAIEVTVDRLASVIADGVPESAVALCLSAKRAVMAVVTALLEPKILLLFDAPRDVLQVIYDMADQLVSMENVVESTGDDAELADLVFGPLIIAAANSFHQIRSLSVAERERLLSVMNEPSGGPKSKKKHTVRYDRVRSFGQTVLSLLAGHVQMLVSLLPVTQTRALMEMCCVLLKEEEEATRRHHDGEKIARKTFAVGAILFVQLVVAVALTGTDNESSVRKVVGLVRLLHDRLGEHELCSLDCFDKAIGSGKCVGKSYVQVAASILQDWLADHNSAQLARRRLKSLARKTKKVGENSEAKSDVEASNEDNAVDEDEEEEGFDYTLAQSYWCLYDVHIVTGCVDHKTGASIGDLESASAKTLQQFAQFAIPIMFRRPPRSNAQKKENMKILLALQRANNGVQDRVDSQVVPTQLFLQYLSPTSLLSWKEDIPLSTLDSMVSAGQDSCMGDLWYLLGENFILHRVRKRSNLGELIEMERKVKERIAYLLKDIQHYRPRRMKSWIRLGRSAKELYHVASDACALLLGRKWRKRVLLAARVAGEHYSQASPSFQDVVLDSLLFEKMKVWHDIDDNALKASYRVRFQNASTQAVGVGLVPPYEYSIEETAELYLAQVVEFSRRCFAMAAALATRSCVACGTAMADEGITDAVHDEDAIQELQAAVDAYEDCGLLMYNQLREFAVLREDEDIVSANAFPLTLYSQILDQTLQCFQDGLALSSKTDSEAHDVRFRFHYMIGKVLKKRLGFQKIYEKQRDDLMGCVTTPGEVMKSFASAEDEHEQGKMDKSIVHAFYQLQAMRTMLILDEPITIENLQLACEHFFEEDVDEDDEMDGEQKQEDGSSARLKVGKDDIIALLKMSEQAESKCYLLLAQGWLFFNVIDALESISDEDRYFHASRYTLARAMYRYNDIVEHLSSIAENLSLPAPSTSAKHCIEALADLKTKKKNDGNSPVEIALKEMHPLFDKRRPQVVAIWLSEHVPTSKKFEELNQRQTKFDFCRIKYLAYFVRLLQEHEAYGRLKEIGSWVIACKEEHDAIDEMLGIALHARSVVQLSRLRDYVCTELVDQLERCQKNASESRLTEGIQDVEARDIFDTESACESLVKELSKAYVNYLDVAHASSRLAAIMPNQVFQEICSLAEFPIVTLYLIGVTEFPTTFEVLNGDDVLTEAFLATATLRVRAVLLNDPTPPAVIACVAVDWKPLLLAARTFCEDRWPERQSGKNTNSGKHTKKTRQAKAPVATPSISTTTSTSAASTLPAAVIGNQLCETDTSEQHQIVQGVSVLLEVEESSVPPPPESSIMRPSEI